MTPTYIGIDLETTGLDPARDRIIEIAVLILSSDLTELGAWDTAITCPLACVMAADPYVKQMHVTGGLWDEAGAFAVPTVSLADAECVLLQLLSVFPSKPVLVGSSVQFDRSFLQHWMPAATHLLSHRNLDDRTIKELAPQLDIKPTERPHRALPDIRQTVEFLRAGRVRLTGGA